LFGYCRDELSQSTIRARWRRSCRPSARRNRSHEMAYASLENARDQRLWTVVANPLWIARRYLAEPLRAGS
jgi:hypothetical protein